MAACFHSLPFSPVTAIEKLKMIAEEAPFQQLQWFHKQLLWVDLQLVMKVYSNSSTVGGWTNPFEKICASQNGNLFPQISGWLSFFKKNVSCHRRSVMHRMWNSTSSRPGLAAGYPAGADGVAPCHLPINPGPTGLFLVKENRLPNLCKLEKNPT